MVPYAVAAGNRRAALVARVASLTRQLSHVKAWADCVHVPRIAPVLEEIMGPNYVCTGMGGELTAPGAVDYQELHSDLGDGDVVYDGVRMKNWDAPSAPAVVVNFAVCDLHDLNGPTAQVTAAVAGFSTQTRRCPATPTRAGTSSASTVLVGGRLPAGSSSSATPAWHAGTVNVTADGSGRCRTWSTRRPGTRAGARRRAAARPRGLDAEGRRLCARIADDEPDRAGRRAEHPRVAAGRSATATRSASTSTRPPRPPSSSRRTTEARTPACAAPSPRRTPTPATPSTSRRRRRSPPRGGEQGGAASSTSACSRRPPRVWAAYTARRTVSAPATGSRASLSASRTATESSTLRSQGTKRTHSTMLPLACVRHPNIAPTAAFFPNSRSAFRARKRRRASYGRRAGPRQDRPAHAHGTRSGRRAARAGREW